MSTAIYKKEKYCRKTVTLLKADGDELENLCKAHNVSFSTLAYIALQEYVLHNFGVILMGNFNMRGNDDNADVKET